MKIAILNPSFGEDFVRVARWAAKSRGRVQRHPDYLLIAAQVLIDAGHDVGFIEAAARNFTPEESYDLCEEFQPDLLVIHATTPSIYNDIEPLEKIKIYDKGVNAPKHTDSYGDFQFSYRYGDTFSPMLNDTEPLKLECKAFIECVKDGKKPLTDGENGLEVVKVLHAADISLHNGGGRVAINNSFSKKS